MSVQLPRTTMKAYFETIGVMFDSAQITKLLSAFDTTDGETVQLDFDVAPAYGDAVGVTLTPADGAQWRTLLAALVAARLCTALKARELLHWPRIMSVRSGVLALPVRLERFLSHIKLTCRPGAPRRAKAYFGATSHFPWQDGVAGAEQNE